MACPATAGKMPWSLSLSFPCQFPIPLGDHERETRMITFRPSIFCSYETMNFGKIWMFMVVALLSGAPVMTENLLNWKYWYYVNVYHADPNYMLYFQVNQNPPNSTKLQSRSDLCWSQRQRFYFFRILSVWSCFIESI